MAKLNPKQARFVAEYLIDLNATQAYIRAGYSRGGASQAAEKLLRNAEVQAAVAKAQEKVAKKLDLTLEGLLQDINDIAKEAWAAAEYGHALTGKITLAKHLGMGLGISKTQVVDESDQPVSTLQLAREIVFALHLGMQEAQTQKSEPSDTPLKH